MIPAGGLRLPSTPETALLEDVGDNNLRAKDHVFMDGSAIFNFVQTEVPPLIENLLGAGGSFARRKWTISSAISPTVSCWKNWRTR